MEQGARRVPPHSIEGERGVLGSIIIEPGKIPIVMEALREEDFYLQNNRIVYKAICDLYQQDSPIDLITLSSRLKEMGQISVVGGVEYLAELASTVPTAENVHTYIKIVYEKALIRKLIEVSSDISSKGYQGGEEVNAILEYSERKIFELTNRKSFRDYALIRDVLVDAFMQLENLYKNKGKVTGVPTGYIDLDNMTSGLQKSDFIIIAARPSMGKTAFALNVVQNASIKYKVPSIIFSLEMSKEQLVQRIICSEALIDSHRLRNGNLEDDDWTRLMDSMKPISQAPVYIDDSPGITVAEMRTKCRRLKAEKNLGLIMIDYLQLMQSSGKRENRQQEISEISRSLKGLARELNVPVIAMAQLSRAPDQRQEHRPMLSDLRESGSLEQDADIVSFLYRDEYYHPDTEKKNIGELIIAKHRNGATGTVELVWLGQFTKFCNKIRD
jgi:replicative DNA helicase